MQWAHVASISRQVVIVNEGSSRLIVIFSVPPFCFSTMFLVIGGVGYMTFSHSFYFPIWLKVSVF